MLIIVVPGVEYFNEETNRFVTLGDTTLELEHSLASLSKWESEFEKPFLGPGEKSSEEVFSYIRSMTLTPNVDPMVYQRLETNPHLVDKITDYINAKMTATTFNDRGPQGPAHEIITAEIVYYWMASLQIPFEAQYWHLNRLFTLIKVMSLKNQPAKKMGRREQAEQQRMLNAQRRAEFNTKG